jgi:hypothetical protein
MLKQMLPVAERRERILLAPGSHIGRLTEAFAFLPLAPLAISRITSRRPATSSQLRARSRRQWIGRGRPPPATGRSENSGLQALQEPRRSIKRLPGLGLRLDRLFGAGRVAPGVGDMALAAVGPLSVARAAIVGGAARRPRSDRCRRRAQARRGSMQRKPCLVPRIDRLSSRNNSDPLAATTHHLDSGNSRRRATNNIRQVAPALPQRRQRRSWRQLLRQ